MKTEHSADKVQEWTVRRTEGMKRRLALFRGVATQPILMAGQVVSPQQIEALAEAINAALAAEREQACKNADARYFEAALAKVKEGK